MHSLYTFAAIGLVIGLIIAIRNRFDVKQYIASTVGCTAAGAFGGTMLALTIFQAGVPMRETAKAPVLLASMRSSDGLSGSFLMGSGSINSRVSYHFLRKLENGSMVPGSVPASDMVFLTEVPELKTAGYWIETVRECDPDTWQYNWAFAHHERTRIIKHEFRVPVGTIVQQFSIR